MKSTRWQSKQAEKQKKAGQSKSTGQKRNGSSEGSTSKWQRLYRVQHHEVSQNECAAYFSLFEDDTDPVEWIECTDKDCRIKSHADCLEQCDNAYVCVACQALLA